MVAETNPLAALCSYAPWMVLVSMVVHLYICPFTKVEESFNMQAMHDVISYGPDLAMYDHNLYPGVVPRTFIGPVGISLLASPIHSIASKIGFDGMVSSFVCRFLVGMVCWVSYTRLNVAVSKVFGNRVAVIMCLLVASSFHIPFYMSRTIPNTFALIGSMFAMSAWLEVRFVCSLFSPFLLYPIIDARNDPWTVC